MRDQKLQILKKLGEKLTIPFLFVGATIVNFLKLDREPENNYRRYKKRMLEKARLAEIARQQAQPKYIRLTFKQIRKMLLEMYQSGLISKSLLGLLLAALVDIYKNSNSQEEKEQILSLLISIGCWFIASLLLL
jgi:hypothetical protein